jgi:hypothetical protein
MASGEMTAWRDTQCHIIVAIPSTVVCHMTQHFNAKATDSRHSAQHPILGIILNDNGD